MINNRKKVIACGILVFIFLIISCNWDIGSDDYKTFTYELRGIWISNDPSIYSGELEIRTDQITISGFNENQTPPGEDSSNRPFKGFTKEVALKGYSEEGKIFIEDGGLLQDGIPYAYYTTGNLSEEKFLRFTFGGRLEIMKKQNTY